MKKIIFLSAPIILLFCYSAVAKLMDIEGFHRQLVNQAIPDWTAPFLVWFIPGVELFLAIILAFEKTRTMAFYGSALLISLFSIYIALVLLNYFDRIPCSCGGVIRGFSFEQHLLFNLFFLILAVLGIYLSKKQKAVTKDEK